MIEIRQADERGRTQLDWLEGRHSFAFGGYVDPAHERFRSLRVLNDDIIQPASGFGEHGHEEMEILTFVVSGRLVHRDSTGGGGELRAGAVQHMSAGTGIRHSEVNPSSDEAARILQVWLLPERSGVAPGYDETSWSPEQLQGQWRLVASRDGRDASLPIVQDVDVYQSRLSPGDSLGHEIAAGRHAWLQVVEGELDVNGHALREGDGAALSDEVSLTVTATTETSSILFNLA